MGRVLSDGNGSSRFRCKVGRQEFGVFCVVASSLCCLNKNSLYWCTDKEHAAVNGKVHSFHTSAMSCYEVKHAGLSSAASGCCTLWQGIWQVVTLASLLVPALQLGSGWHCCQGCMAPAGSSGSGFWGLPCPVCQHGG